MQKITVRCWSPIKTIIAIVMLYGAGLIFAGPVTVRLDEIQWHLFAFGCILIPVAIHFFIKTRNAKPDGASVE